MDYTQFQPGMDPDAYGVCPLSPHTAGDVIAFVAKNVDGADKLVIVRGGRRELLPLGHEAACFLRETFPFTAPSPVLSLPRSFGTGDRLGIATLGQLLTCMRFDVAPVLAQQSIRELKLTGRDYADVLDAVTFTVFRADYQKPWGADGDHLKTTEEIDYALSRGYTMITLDCSEKIGTGEEPFVPDETRDALYLGRSVTLEGHEIGFPEAEYRRMTGIYGAAIDFICEIYARYIEGTALDFEISIDETNLPTTPAQHYFVASELHRRGVRFHTLAPRFCGEFQKGIDYIGDLGQFERELDVHAAIARHFGYKLSVHSGSDKFSVFPLIARATGGRFHLKTAGTSWLEAVKLVAMQDPALYREVHACALRSFAEASRYYHVTTNLANIPPLDTLRDEQLPALFSNNDARQLIHITYGLILADPDLHARLYACWNENFGLYLQLLGEHLGHHLELLTK